MSNDAYKAYEESNRDHVLRELISDPKKMKRILERCYDACMGYNEYDTALFLDAIDLAFAVHYCKSDKEIAKARAMFAYSLSKSMILEAVADSELRRKFNQPFDDD